MISKSHKNERNMSQILKLGLIGLTTLSMISCSGIKTEREFPDIEPGTRGNTLVNRDKAGNLFGDDGLATIFGEDSNSSQGGSGIGVNSFLWRASLDTLSFMPLQSADPFGGVIITDWYANPETPDERFKVTVYILDRRLRADGVRVAAFRQTRSDIGWQDAKTGGATAIKLENAILNRARQLRIDTVQ